MLVLPGRVICEMESGWWGNPNNQAIFPLWLNLYFWIFLPFMLVFLFEAAVLPIQLLLSPSLDYFRRQTVPLHLSLLLESLSQERESKPSTKKCFQLMLLRTSKKSTSSRSNIRRTILPFLITALTIALYFFFHNNMHESTTDGESTSEIFSLLVTLVFQEETFKDEFLREIAPVAEHCRLYESKTTLSYQILQSDQNPLQLMVLERYVDKERAYLQIHKSSKVRYNIIFSP